MYSSRSNYASRQQAEPVVVHCTPGNTTVGDTPFPHTPLCLQIVALPAGYTTPDTVTDLLMRVLALGEPRNVRIFEKKNYNQKLKASIITRTALVDFNHWYNTHSAHSLYGAILGNPEEGEVVADRGQSVHVTVANTPFHWENGDPMTHLSIREGVMPPEPNAVADIVTTSRLTLAEGDWNSLYIPLIPNSMSLLHPDGSIRAFQPKHLGSFIENDLHLGKISRIDFIDRKIDNVGIVKAVFIHFEYWNNNAAVADLRNTLNTQEHVRLNGYYDGRQFNKFIVRNENGDKVPGYFVFKINHKPIPEVAETELNMAQLVAANKVLTEKMAERDVEIRRLTEELTALREATGPTATAVTA
jgi:hypothetical protein